MTQLRSAWSVLDELTTSAQKSEFPLWDLQYKFSMVIFDYRRKYSLSQKELAVKLGVSQAMVAKFESCDYNPTLDQMWKISEKLDLQFDFQFVEKVADSGADRSDWEEISTSTPSLNLFSFPKTDVKVQAKTTKTEGTCQPEAAAA